MHGDARKKVEEMRVEEKIRQLSYDQNKSNVYRPNGVVQWFSNFLRCDAFKKAYKTLRHTKQHPKI